MNETYCPKCKNSLKSVGFTCAGQSLYHCPICERWWEIKELPNEDESTK